MNPDTSVLLEPIPSQNTPYPDAHLIIPDPNILLHHLDVLEKPAFTDAIVLQTVLDEVRNRNIRHHDRIRAMTQQHSKRFFVLSNEHHKETFVSPKEGESDNDRNDRAIRKAASWYMQHNSLKVVLITNDRENARLAREAGITACTLADYVADDEQLRDMVESVTTRDAVEDKDTNYDEHWSRVALESGLQANKIIKGVLRTNPYNPFEGTVLVDQPGVPYTSILVQGRMNMNRGLNGDSVAIELLDKSQWTNQREKAAEEFEEEGGLAVEAVPDETKDVKPSGRVVGVIQRKSRAIIGSIDRNTIKDYTKRQAVLVVPMDRHLPRIRLFTGQAEELRNQRIQIVIDDWQKNSKYPQGHYVKTLGQAGDKTTETEAILLECDVNHEEFTKQVMDCLPDANWGLTEADLAERHDFRDLCICSVDPPGCTDIDDALHALGLPNGNIQVGVHIADVTHFVSAGTPLDREAAARATTVYLVDKRIDMLPGLLGTNLCSLRCDVNRLAFSVIWEIHPIDASIINTTFKKSVIKSKASLTYDQAQTRLDSPQANDDDQVTTSLRLLNSLAKILRAARIKGGSLTLASPEFRFSLDTETQNPVDVEMKEMKDANSMVEEFMLLANISVAKKIHEAYPDSAILRRHPNPPHENFEAINRALESYGFNLDPTTSKTLATTLDQAVLKDDPYFNRLVRIMTTRCMLQAVYFSAGSLTQDLFWHYGLATPIYTHFTSPIRRYADVIVHRQLAACLNVTTTHFRDNVDPTIMEEFHKVIRNKQRVEDLAHNINYRHRMAQQAQRSSVELFTHMYFHGRGMVREAAYIIKMMQNGFVVMIPQYGIESLVHVEEDQPIKYDADNNRFDLNGQCVLKLFQRVTVEMKVEEVEVSQKQKLVVKLVEPDVLTSDVNSKKRKSVE